MHHVPYEQRVNMHPVYHDLWDHARHVNDSPCEYIYIRSQNGKELVMQGLFQLRSNLDLSS